MSLNNFFMIVGGQKCGTTSVHNWLDQHPDICMSYPKEPKFFEIDFYKGRTWYENEFFSEFDADRTREETIFGEARVQNILVKYVPDRIKLYNQNTKIVIMVRNPIDRFISAWNHFKVMRPGRETRTLEETIHQGAENFDLNCFDSEEKFYANLDPMGGPYGGRYLEHGMYSSHIKRFNDMFDTQILVLDDLVTNPEKEYLDLLNFVGAKYFMPDFVKMNVKNPKIDYGHERLLLRSFYRDSVDDLSQGLKRDLTTEWGFK